MSSTDRNRHRQNRPTGRPENRRVSRCSALLLALATSTAGCYSWSRTYIPVPHSEPSNVSESRSLLRVHRRGEPPVVLHDAIVRWDSVIGYTDPGRRSASRVAIVRQEIFRFDTRDLDEGDTALLLLGVPAAAGLAFVIACAAAGCFHFGFSGSR